MIDQSELIEQYRTTLEVMKEKLLTLRKDKQQQLSDLEKIKDVSPEFQRLKQSSHLLQENVQSLNFEIFKEKGNLRKLKADNEWEDDKFQYSEEIKSLKYDLEESLALNSELKSERASKAADSRLAQLEFSNPKLFALVKKIIIVEEVNFIQKDRLESLEQERNRLRSEYSKITQFLGQEEKIKLKIREVEMDIDKSEINYKFFQNKIKDLTFDLHREQENLKQNELTGLRERFEAVKERKEESALRVDEMLEGLELIEAEISKELSCEGKVPPTNLKQEIKNLEGEITDRTKELKARLAERKKLQAQYEGKLKLSSLDKKTKGKNIKDIDNKPSGKTLLFKSASTLIGSNKVSTDSAVVTTGKLIMESSKKEIKNVLRHVGSQDQGMTTKLVKLNRDDFLRKIKLNK